MTPYGLGCRDPVGGKFHHERKIVILDETLEYQGRKNRQQDAQQVDAQQRQAGMLREEGPGQQDEYRQASGAGHEGKDGYGYQPAFGTLDGPCSHDGRHIASESHHHGDEGLAVKPELMHEPVHYECSPGHVARVFHQG